MSLLAVVALVLVFFRDARAASNDKEVEELIGSAVDDFGKKAYADALDKLEVARQACEGTSCSAKVRARVWMAIGAVQAKKKPAEAKKAFEAGLKDDPSATLPKGMESPEGEKILGEAKGGGSPPPPPGAPDPQPPGGKRKPKKAYAGQGAAPRGWKSAEAAFYYDEAKAAEGRQEWADCYDNAYASAQAESRSSTRWLGGQCAERASLWVEAIAEYQVAGDAGNRGAAAKAKELSQKVPKLIIRKPAKAVSLEVRLDDVVVPLSKLDGEMWVNPGQRAVSARGNIDGVPFEFEQAVDVAEFETATVEIKPGGKGTKDPVVTRCMLQAKTTEEIAKCINANTYTRLLDWRISTELAFYSDSDRVDVVSPAIALSVENKTDGYGINAAFVVDVVTAASSDIIATASPRWTEVRYAPSLGGHKRFGDVDLSLRGGTSIEPDYIATNAGASISVELARKTITPTLSYEFSYDISGRASTNFDVFSRRISRHGVDLATTFVLDKATFAAFSFTGVFEDGDTSKPYRYIPVFAEDVYQQVRPGQSIESVNAARLPLRILEQLPTNRQRFAVAAKLAHRFASSTLRAEERLYIDSWGLKASTTDAKFLIDVGKKARLWPHVRFHIQDDVDFWRIAYPAIADGAGQLQIPAYRTGDRELGSLLGLTLGGGVRFGLGDKGAVGLTLTGDFIYTRFFDTLFIINKFGGLGTATLEASF